MSRLTIDVPAPKIRWTTFKEPHPGAAAWVGRVVIGVVVQPEPGGRWAWTIGGVSLVSLGLKDTGSRQTMAQARVAVAEQWQAWWGALQR